MANEARKEALKTVSNEIKLMVDEDLNRVAKLVKAELVSRTVLDKLTKSMDDAE